VTEFDARAVAFRRDEEIGAEYLVLAELEDGSGQRLELQRPSITTNEDRRLGTDTYCLVNEAGVTHYGGVEGWSVETSTLEVRLDEEAAKAFDVDGGFRINLIGDRKMADVVRDGLQAILRAS
jgi:hypothetical protein